MCEYESFIDKVFGNNGIILDVNKIICDYMHPKEYLKHLLTWLKDPKYNITNNPFIVNDNKVPVVLFNNMEYYFETCKSIATQLVNIGRPDMAEMVSQCNAYIWRANRDIVITFTIAHELLKDSDINISFINVNFVDYFKIIHSSDFNFPVDEKIKLFPCSLMRNAIYDAKLIDISNLQKCQEYILRLSNISDYVDEYTFEDENDF